MKRVLLFFPIVLLMILAILYFSLSVLISIVAFFEVRLEEFVDKQLKEIENGKHAHTG